MTIPLMAENLVFVPKAVSFLVLIGLVIAGIAEWRKCHIGRIGIATNAFLLWQIFFPFWIILPNWFQWYLNIGTILGALAIVSYFPLWRFSLPTELYKFAFMGYGSFSVILAIVVYFLI